jgi:hypothetical protein
VLELISKQDSKTRASNLGFSWIISIAFSARYSPPMKGNQILQSKSSPRISPPEPCSIHHDRTTLSSTVSSRAETIVIQERTPC